VISRSSTPKRRKKGWPGDCIRGSDPQFPVGEEKDMHRILIPFDGSPAAERAIAFVLGLVQEGLGAEVVLLSVEHSPYVFGEVAVYVRQEVAQEMAFAAAERTLALADPLFANTALNVHRVARVGEVAETIVAVAKERKCDWIVMGSRGMGAFANLLLGSVATKVVASTAAPVTVVH